ncbi:MAG: hypothetical protein HYY17_12490 [Planctomycetes bacterium]|nr:hypothetical protein [Planctomycetota bacterium]
MRWILAVLFASLLPFPPGPAAAPPAPAVRQDDEELAELVQRMKKLCAEKNWDLAWELAGEIVRKAEGISADQLADAVMALSIQWAATGKEIGKYAAKMPEFYRLVARTARHLHLPRHEFAALALLYAVEPGPELGRRLLQALNRAKLVSFVWGDGRKVQLFDRYVGHYCECFPDDLTGKLLRVRTMVTGRRFNDAIPLIDAIHQEAGRDAKRHALLLPEACYWRARAELNRGDFAAASSIAQTGSDYVEAAVKELSRRSGEEDEAQQDREELVRLSNELAQTIHDCLEANRMGLYLSFTAPEFLPLGFYHLMSETHGPLPPFLELHIVNGWERDRTIVFSSEVLDVTYASIDQFVLPARAAAADKKKTWFNMRVYQTPPIRADFRAGSVAESIERPIKITVAEKTDQGDRVLLTRTIPVSVWPRTRFVQRLPARGGDMILNSNALVAWVTPRGRWVQDAIKGAKEHLPKDLEFYGVGAANVRTSDQVGALYNYLKKDRTVSYVGTALGWEKGCHYQEIRMPAEIMQTSNALCIEGTSVFATLIEAIGLEPVIILIPGHAFVGWYDDKKGPVSYRGRKMYVLETTAIFKAEFEQALKMAENTWKKDGVAEKVNKVTYDFLEVRQLRERGYLPQPYPETGK